MFYTSIIIYKFVCKYVYLYINGFVQDYDASGAVSI